MPRKASVYRSNGQAGLGTNGLEGWLWEAACSIRGAVDAPKFKDYILPLIFVKRLSDVFDDELERLVEKFGDRETALELVEEDHSLVRFYLPSEGRWPAIRSLTTGVGQRVTSAIRAITRANTSLQGVIDIVDFNATVSGQRIIEDERLVTLVEVLSRHRLGLNDVEPDVLGRAYEYLLRKFAEGQGQSAGEFFTPKEVGWLIARVLDPREGMDIHDPACGSAGLLIKAQLTLRGNYPDARRPLRLFGQELNHVTYAIAKMNMIIHDMEGEIAIGDTLRTPRFSSGSRLQQFDLVAANPMWNQPGYSPAFYESDSFGRFQFGYPTSNSADWGWLQHMAAALKSTGRAAVVLDAAAVSRGSGDDSQSKEKQIRAEFVDEDLIEAVILLPDNLFYNTTAQGIIVLLNRAKPADRKEQILLIDGSDEFHHQRPKNVLTDAGAGRIADAVLTWKSTDGFAVVVSNETIKGRDYNINPARYIERAVQRVGVDIAEAIGAIEQWQAHQLELQSIAGDLIGSLEPTASDGEIPSGWSEKVFGQIAEFTLGRTPSRSRPRYFSTTDGTPWVTITDMAAQPVVKVTKERISAEALHAVFRDRIVPANTLLMSIKLTVGRTAFTGVDAVHNEAIVSIIPDDNEVLPRYLFYLLPLINYRQYQDRAVKGQTINLGKLRQMKLRLPPVDEQETIVRGLDSLLELQAVDEVIASTRGKLRDEIVHHLINGSMRVGSG